MEDGGGEIDNIGFQVDSDFIVVVKGIARSAIIIPFFLR